MVPPAEKGGHKGRRDGRLYDDTVEPSATIPPLEPGLVPTLTVLHHPESDRVGDRARLYGLRAGRRVAVSRLEPDLTPPGGSAAEARPLADPAVSRSPFWLRPGGDGDLVIDATETGSRVTVDGESLEEARTIPAAALARGVVLEVARRVVLLLHRTDPRVERVADTDRATLIGENDAVERIRSEVRSVADTTVPVLLRGETGTGKELLAHAIHAASRRAGRPFVSVNMAAIPAPTATSTLFGHTRGAFTGALRDHVGFFQQADGGTLFLDEVGDTPPDVQVMLLRVLETGEVQRVGGQRHETVDVRLIAATDADLQALTLAGAFRAPLLHRLSAYEIVAPPLRERRDDIARLLLHFLRLELRAVGAEHRLAAPDAGARPWLPVSLVARLVRHDWPGNVRQLHNFVRQLVIANRSADQIDARELLVRLFAEERPLPKPAARPRHAPEDGEDATVEDGAKRRKPPAEIDEIELVAALRRNRWRPGPTARELGISRTSLYGLIDRSARIRKARDLGPEEIQRFLDAFRGDVDRMAERLEVSPRGLKLRLRELGLTP